jgi:hypothetical protein
LELLGAWTLAGALAYVARFASDLGVAGGRFLPYLAIGAVVEFGVLTAFKAERSLTRAEASALVGTALLFAGVQFMHVVEPRSVMALEGLLALALFAVVFAIPTARERSAAA